ncbi:hypothetical protein GCM10025298_02310 [Natronobiforma cellulositropha]
MEPFSTGYGWDALPPATRASVPETNGVVDLSRRFCIVQSVGNMIAEIDSANDCLGGTGKQFPGRVGLEFAVCRELTSTIVGTQLDNVLITKVLYRFTDRVLEYARSHIRWVVEEGVIEQLAYQRAG